MQKIYLSISKGAPSSREECNALVIIGKLDPYGSVSAGQEK